MSPYPWYQGEMQLPAGVLAHYTTGHALRKIVKDGVLRPHRATPLEQQATIWLSTEPLWEPSAGRLSLAGTPLSMSQMAATYGGLARVLVDSATAPLGVTALRRIIGGAMQHTRWGGRTIVAPASSPQLDALFASLEGKWFGAIRPIARAEWRGVEVWKSQGWVALPWERWGQSS